MCYNRASHKCSMSALESPVACGCHMYKELNFDGKLNHLLDSFPEFAFLNMSRYYDDRNM